MRNMPRLWRDRHILGIKSFRQIEATGEPKRDGVCHRQYDQLTIGQFQGTVAATPQAEAWFCLRPPSVGVRVPSAMRLTDSIWLLG